MERHLRSPMGRADALASVLDRFQRRFDAAARLLADPVEFPRRYPDPADAEVAGLLASCLAYGRADVFKGKLEAVLAAAAPSPAAFAARLARHPDAEPFAGFRYRFNRPEDVGALFAAAGWVRELHGSLGRRFAVLFGEAKRQGGPWPVRSALSAFAGELRAAPPAQALLSRRGLRGLRHLCPDPAAGGASKRLNLYLRWMVRGPDGVDLGIWREVPAAELVVPLDTHVARVARCLGLTSRTDLSWRTAEEVTRSLRDIDPRDPVRFDFALCHLGMSGGCPARRDSACCRACPLREVCPAGRRVLSQRCAGRGGPR
ncbi:MAG TPA: TIGR02757 family protein [Anaeromyxobacteraceae bacterium]|nr:TIGR02757 family protein [Anaeromyxobacteraceae bacterium]